MKKRNKKNFSYKDLLKKFAIAALVIVNALSVALIPTQPAFAASFTFTQNDWAVSADTNATAGHTGGAAQTGVTSFYSTSSPFLMTGADLTIATSTGSFAQTNWTTINQTTTANHTSNQTGWTSASTTDTQIDYTGTAGSLKLALSSYSATDDGTFSTTGSATGGGFGNGTNSQTAVNGTGTGANVGLLKSSTVSWITSYDTAESYIYSLTFDSTNGVIYASSGSNGIIYRCVVSTTGCDASGDWTISYDTSEADAQSLIFANGVIYAGSGFNGIIYRCAVSTACDASGDWTISYDTAELYIYSLTFDSTNGVIYAGSAFGGGVIYRCAVSTACDASGDWTISYDTAEGSILSLTFDSTNGVIYAGSGSGVIYRCAVSTACDASGDWTISYGTPELYIYSLTFDSTNGVIYAGSSSNGIIYRCAVSTACDASGDWTTSYDTAEGSILSLTFDSTNGVIYAGSGSGGIIYRCAVSTACDASGDWTTSYDTAESQIRSLGSDSTNGVIYAGSSANGIIYRGAANYSSPGTFTSAAIDLGASSSFTTLSWNATLNGQTMTIKARSSQDGSTWRTNGGGANSWTNCVNLTSGGALSSGGCVTDGDRYIQYQAALSTANTAVTPTLNDITFNYSQYPTASGYSLVSSPFNTEDSAKGISSVSWTGATTSAASLKFQVRTANSLAGLATASWCGPANCSGTDYFVDANNNGAIANTALTDGSNDQWFQYKAILTTSNGAVTPQLNDVTTAYRRALDSVNGYALISSPYDSGSAVSVIGDVRINVGTLPSGTSAKIQVRAAATQGGLSSATWCGPADCAGSSYWTATGTGLNTFSTIPAALIDGTNDQWFQYRITLIPSSDALNAPYTASASVTYAINTAPTVTNVAATTAAITNGAAITDAGKITVTYDVTDDVLETADTYEAYLFYDVGVTLTSDNTTTLTVSDTSRMPAAPGYVQIGTEVVKYGAIVNSTTLGTLTRGSSDNSWPGNATRHTRAYASDSVVWIKANAVTGDVGSVTKGTGKTIVWDQRNESQLANYSHYTAKVRVLVHDNNTVNQLSSQNGSSTDSSNTVIIDNLAPTFGLTFDAGVAGSTDSASVTVTTSGDATSTAQYMIADDAATHASPASTAWTTFTTPGSRTWTFDSDFEIKTLKAQARDPYGNAAATSTVSTIMPAAANAFLAQDVSNIAISDWRLFIGWEMATSPNFASYKLEYATSTDNITYSSYISAVSPITSISANYYTHQNLTTSWHYRYRIGVTAQNGSTSIRSNTSITAKPDGIQNFGEGGGGVNPRAAMVANMTPTQGTDGNVTTTYTLVDASQSSKTTPSYQGYMAYDLGVTLTSSSTATLLLSDTSKLPVTNGYIQINQEVIKYASNNTSTNTLSGIERGTWPTTVSSGRATRQNTTMFAQVPVWIMATSTGISIANTTISTGQSESLTWNPRNDGALSGNYFSNVGIRALVHDGQSASFGPISSQNDLSNDGKLAALDLKAPVLVSTTLLINGSSSAVESAGSAATLSVGGVTSDASNNTLYVQFATSTPATYRGANADGTLNMTADSWGTATTLSALSGLSWSWPLSSRSETVTVRVKDAYGNISTTDTNSIIKNAVPEFNGTQSDADASNYETKTNSTIVIRQCNVYDTDPLCATGKVKIKFQVRDPDAAESTRANPDKIHTNFAFSLNGTAYATSTVATYSNGSSDAQAGTSTVFTIGSTSDNSGGVSELVNYDPVFTTVTAYYDPGLGSSATISARIAVTDNEEGSALQYATSNTIAYDKINPSGSITFDGGAAGIVDSGTIIIPVPTDATTTQYMISATSTAGVLTTYGWTTVTSSSSVPHGFDSAADAKSVNVRLRDTYGNTTGTTTVASLAPPAGSSVSVQDISKTATAAWQTFISWEASVSGSFALYRIQYATSPDNASYGAYTDLITIPTATTNYYLHSGLSNALYYRYRVSVKNSAGNYSVNAVVSGNPYFTAKPDGTRNQDETAADDTTAPSVNTVTSSAVKATSATITFNSTDNASLAMNSAVYFATQTDYTNNVTLGKTGRDRYISKVGNPGYVTVASVGATAAHSVALTNVAKNMQYRYAAESCDATGNCAFEDASGAGYTFTTQNGPAIVSGSIAATPSFDSASITWKTDKPSDSIVFYATTSSSSLANPVSVGSNAQVTSADGNGHYVHTVTIPNLTYSATYYYKVRSTDQNAGSDSYTQYDESTIRSLTTTTPAPPVITTAAACSTTYSTVTVTWTTDQFSTTELSLLSADVGANYFSTVAGAQVAQYPTGTIDNASRAAAGYVTAHSNTFTGLTERTTYYVKVRSLNASGGEVSSTLSCATSAKEVITVGRTITEIGDITPPLIASLVIKDIKATSATIVWTTDEQADSLVKYGVTMNYGGLAGSEEMGTDHSVTVSGLNPKTTYNFKVTSADQRGNRAYSGDQSFTTLSAQEEALLAKEDLESLKKELEELRGKAKTQESLKDAVQRFKSILKAVSTDVSLQDLEEITTDITDTISEITQEIVPPAIIGGVPQVDIDSNKAIITWRTNKPAGSIIALVPQDEYDSSAKDPYAVQVGQPQEEVTEHTVTVPNLNPATIYHFQIRSQAKVGPEGKSRDFVFETKPELPQILSYSFKRITENSITVVWKTNTLSNSQVRYTPFSDGELLSKEAKTQGKPEFVKEHEVTVDNLSSNTNFLIEISSADVIGTSASKVIGTIRTTVDEKAPVIGKVRSESTIFPGKTERIQTIIYWETDEPSTSQIFWKEGVGKGDLVGFSKFDQEYTTSHVMVITNFKPGTVYRFQVESADPSNNKGRSTDFTILTPKKGETVIDLIITNFQDIFGFLKQL